MIDSQKSNTIVRNLAPITSLEQLLSSYLVAECIVEIRGERQLEIQSLAKDSIPKLAVQNKVLESLYERFCAIISYKPTFVLLAKIGIEDMINYNFQSEPSVMSNASGDTSHLQQVFGPSFSSLAKINLFDHSLRVFKNGLDVGERQGRIMQIAIPMLGCLFHDFGKCPKIRNEILGPDIGKGYKAHADVSQLYVREILASKFSKISNISAAETIDMLALAVQNHHAATNKTKNDTMIKFISTADIAARKEELKIIQKINNGDM